MAGQPCKVGMHIHRGRNVNVYVNLYWHGVTQRALGRFCGPHWAEIERGLAEFEVDPDGSTVSDSQLEGLCFACLEPRDKPFGQAFITSYPAKNERKDYWASVHEGCYLPPYLGPYMNNT